MAERGGDTEPAYTACTGVIVALLAAIEVGDRSGSISEMAEAYLHRAWVASYEPNPSRVASDLKMATQLDPSLSSQAGPLRARLERLNKEFSRNYYEVECSF